jgi:hypothetical protein
MASSEAITGMYDTASSAKHQPSPTSAINPPATAGPTMRLPFTIDELSAMAFERSARSSSSVITNAWRAGVSKAPMTPCASWSTSTCHTVTWPDSVNAARSVTWTSESTCVQINTRCRSQRSTYTPARGPRNSIGICEQKLTSPSRNAESVSR